MSRIEDLKRSVEFSAKMMNQRVDIENLLIAVSQGKHPPLTLDDCRVIALRLGTPREHWADSVKNHKFGVTH